jgi:hypothetical protein
MGLDWMVHKTKPREGCEARFAELTRLLNDMREDGATSPSLEEELEGISVNVGEVIGAPRIGVDERADRWFREVYDENRAREDGSPEFAAHWSRPFEDLLEENRGRYVLELAEDQGGMAAVSGIVATSLDFRGKIVGSCPLLSRDLREEAYEDHSAEEMLDYARRLRRDLQGGVESLEPSRGAARRNENDWEDAVDAAIRWLEFWGEKGFGYWAWY